MVEISVKQRNCKRNNICGDVVNCEESENNFKAILCDGMGHGIKANLLAMITQQIVKRHNFDNDCLSLLTKQLLSSQPVCAVRKTNHSTYTVVNYHKDRAVVEIVNYNNPKPIIYSNNQFEDISWRKVVNKSYPSPRPQNIEFATIPVEGEICIVMCSDGVVESGIGGEFSFGWGENRLKEYILPLLQSDYSVTDIATSVVATATEFENNYAHDDITCVAIKIIM